MDCIELSIIIVNYNGIKYINDCLNSIQRFVNVSHEVIVVDNASSDDSVSYIKKNFPYIKVIVNNKNYGFSRANNIGFKNASGNFVLLLNNDTILINEVSIALNFLKKNPRVGVLGAKMLNSDLTYRHSVRYFPSLLRLFKFSSRVVKSGPFLDGNFCNITKDDYYEVDYVEGSFLLTVASIWQEVGGLDENLFMYGEDAEYCYAVKCKGYITVYFPLVEYIHFGGFTIDREHLVVCGAKHFHKKWSPWYMYNAALCILYFRLFCKIVFYGILHLVFSGNDYKQKYISSLHAIKVL